MHVSDKKTTHWYFGEHTLDILDGSRVIKFIGDELREYQVINPIQPPLKQPKLEGQQDLKLLRVALGNLDIHDDIPVLDFVNQWGLLGLWKMEEYRDRYEGVREFQEPLSLFRTAAAEYQNFSREMAGLVDEEDWKEPTKRILNRINGVLLKACFSVTTRNERLGFEPAWYFRSLLDAVYIQSALDLLEKRYIKRCRKYGCGKYYLTNQEDSHYCSENHRIAHHTMVNRRNKWKKELLKNTETFLSGKALDYHVKKQLLKDVEEKLELFLRSEGATRQNLQRKIRSYIENELNRISDDKAMQTIRNKNN